MADGATEGETYELPARLSSYPRDLLRRFDGNSGGDGQPEAASGDSGEVELSLGLSLGGCFGVEPKEKKNLVRSSSISTISMFSLDHQPDFPAVPPLPRTCSLPTETEEERRKRKELQSLKRLEAKRKRSEKRNAISRPRDRKDEILDEEAPPAAAAKVHEVGGCLGFPGNPQVPGKVNGVVVAPPESPRWAAVVAGRAGVRPASQGSIGSQGSSSSAVSDYESKPMQGLEASGLSNCTEVRSPPMIPPLPNHTNQKASAIPPDLIVRKPSTSTVEEDEPSKKKHSSASCRTNGVKEMERNMMEEMPCVSTRGDGPNGRRIEGFLYKYRKGEEVRIVCVCHGSFLTPAEFVKHAGGGDVAHPLRHIVVSPTPATFFS